jgi:glycine/D-amino acid oxidase-like deaminating enzyme
MTVPHNTPVWDDHPWSPLPPLEHDLDTEICVVGLGGSGLTCIIELLAMGRRVVGIDAADVAAGAAGRNGGFLLAGTADFHHDAVRLLGRARAGRIHALTLEEIGRIAEQAPGSVRFNGSIRLPVSDEERADCTAQRVAMEADGIPVADHGALGDGALFFAGDAQFNPLSRCRALAHTARAAGARLFGRTPAVAVDGTGVQTPGGMIHCDAVIVAVDGRLERLLPELDGAVRTARLQMLATAPTTDVAIPCPVYARYGFDYWQQLPDGRVALGGGRDIAMEDEWTGDADPTDVIQSHLDRVLRERIGTLAPVTHRWAASVSYTDTGLPVFAEVRPDVWAIGAYSGTGNAIGALCGRAAAHVVCGEPSEFATLLQSH